MSALSKICRRSSACGSWHFWSMGFGHRYPRAPTRSSVSMSTRPSSLICPTASQRSSSASADRRCHRTEWRRISGYRQGLWHDNLLALDRNGRVLMSRMVEVRGRWHQRHRHRLQGYRAGILHCAPNCERRITLGDSPGFFNATFKPKRCAQRPGAGCKIATPDAVHGFHAYRPVNARA